MNVNNLHKEICMAIFQVIELCYQQGVTTTWQDIYKFLRIPHHYWENDPDLEEKIIISSDQELAMVKDLILSRFETIH